MTAPRWHCIILLEASTSTFRSVAVTVKRKLFSEKMGKTMKMKWKKLIAMMVLGVTLCGSVLTAQAATPRTCINHGRETNERVENVNTVSTVHTHSDASGTYQCSITTTYRKKVITCAYCGVELARVDIDPDIKHTRIN